LSEFQLAMELCTTLLGVITKQLISVAPRFYYKLMIFEYLEVSTH